MDLKELQNRPGQRHPWESARLKAIKKIIGRLDEGIKVLDIGCGDGFVCSTLFSNLKQKQITAVDINLTEAQIQGLKTSAGAISYRKELPEDGAFDLTLLLDVIEHVEDDRAFLARIVDRHVARGGGADGYRPRLPVALQQPRRLPWTPQALSAQDH